MVLGFIEFAQASVREVLRDGRVFEWLPSWRVTLEEMKDIAAQLDSVLCAIKANYKLR